MNRCGLLWVQPEEISKKYAGLMERIECWAKKKVKAQEPLPFTLPSLVHKSITNQTHLSDSNLHFRVRFKWAAGVRSSNICCFSRKCHVYTALRQSSYVYILIHHVIPSGRQVQTHSQSHKGPSLVIRTNATASDDVPPPQSCDFRIGESFQRLNSKCLKSQNGYSTHQWM